MRQDFRQRTAASRGKRRSSLADRGLSKSGSSRFKRAVILSGLTETVSPTAPVQMKGEISRSRQIGPVLRQATAAWEVVELTA